MTKSKDHGSDSLGIEVHVVEQHESEVTVGSDVHRVSIRSKAPVESLVAHAKDLYQSCAPKAATKEAIGFAPQLVERRETAVPPSSTLLLPIKDI